MNQRSDTDRLLRHWMSDGSSTMPDRVLDVVADRISRQPQRRTWRLRGRPIMNTYAKLGLAAAAVLIVAVVGYNLLPRQGGPGVPSTPVPTTVPTAAPTASSTAVRPRSGKATSADAVEATSPANSSAIAKSFPPASMLLSSRFRMCAQRGAAMSDTRS